MKVGLIRAGRRGMVAADLVDAPASRVEDAAWDDAAPPAVRSGVLSRLRPGSPAWVWLALAVAIAGFVLIAVAWGQVAGETQVHRQLPYVVSAGFVGVGLVMVGLALLNIGSRYRSAVEDDRQIDELVGIIEELQAALSGESRKQQ